MTDLPTFHDPDVQEHHEREGLKGMSNEWFALIPKPISYQKAMQIEDARKAINKEWDKLEGYPAWKFETVQEQKANRSRCKSYKNQKPRSLDTPSKTHSPMPSKECSTGQKFLVLQRQNSARR